MTAPSQSPLVLIVEDEEAIATMIRYNLEKEGMRAEVAADGAAALVAIEDRRPDLVLMDWMLPIISGVELCQRLRREDATRDIPVIMLTARGEETDKLMGLDSGADDYMVKPFSPRELIARIRAVLRRTRPALVDQTLSFAGVSVNMAARRVTFEGRTLHLGPTEFRLLAFLMEKPGRVFSREQLLNAVWGDEIYVEERTVDVHIRRLRKTLAEASPGLDGIIQTVRAAGYMLDMPEGVQPRPG